ncbi:HERV-H LTR-associating protein 1 [Osmerus mordax]|uniref:HERV-H LTR-associating protein 1 n=1 Tax=Osmerus mordax TaxID=8014 RepID=UPI00350FCC58
MSKRDVLASTEIPAQYIDPAAIDLTPLVNTLINSTQSGSHQLFSLLSVTSHSSLALHKLTLLVYNISSFRSFENNMFPKRYCYCVTNETNDLTDFTAILLDVMGNSTSYLHELFKSSSILSVSQKNHSDCTYICVMAGKTDKELSKLWEVDSIKPLFNQTITEDSHRVGNISAHKIPIGWHQLPTNASHISSPGISAVLTSRVHATARATIKDLPTAALETTESKPPTTTAARPTSTPTNINTSQTNININTSQTNINTSQTNININTSQININTSQTNINTNQTNFSTSQTNINTSQTNINTSQTNINTSQTNINTSQTNIHTSQTDINTSQTNINTSQTNINTSQTNINTIRPISTSTPVRPTSTPVRPTSTPTNINTSQTNINTSQTNINTSQTKINTSQTNINTSQTNIHTSQTNINTTTTRTRVITRAPVTEKPGCPWRRPALHHSGEWTDDDLTSATPTTTVSAHKLQPCVLELCKFFSQCLCRSYGSKTRMRYCADSHLWYEKHTFEVCRRVRRVSFSKNLKQRCLARMCNKL